MAANTDKLKKLSRRWVGQIGSGGVADAVVTTVPLSSTTNLATDTAVVATINRVDSAGGETPSSEETVIGVVSGSNLINCTRGVEGTAQAHSAGAVVEILVTAKGWNDLIDMLLVAHNQDGTHKSLGNATASTITASDITATRLLNAASDIGRFTSPRITTGISDASGNELLLFTATASAVNELTYANAATGLNPTITASGETNTGLDMKMKGTGRFRRPTIVELPIGDTATAITTGDGKVGFRIPAELNGMNLTGVAANLFAVSSSGIPTFQLRRSRRSSATARTDADMLSTKLTVDANEFESSDAAAAAVIDTANDDVQTGDMIYADIDVAGTGAKYPVIELRFELPS